MNRPMQYIRYRRLQQQYKRGQFRFRWIMATILGLLLTTGSSLIIHRYLYHKIPVAVVIFVGVFWNIVLVYVLRLPMAPDDIPNRKSKVHRR